MDSAAAGAREPPGIRRAAEHATELLSLIISGEEEAAAARERREEDGLANGHGGAEPGVTPGVTPAASPCTSYWSISEGPDRPLLLSPAPGPPGRKPRVQRASRPGLSRIPGRDHRRYYHEYWRSEYLMDFDPQRHGMICMVCGSSLATLKLSTIKRHIRQKHPDSLLWSAADKEVIRSGWESHLSLGAGQGGYPTQVKEERPDAGQPAAEGSDPEPQDQEPQTPLILPPDPEEDEEEEEEEEEVQVPQKEADPSCPSARTLERYLNDSLHAWFRQEFLMEYEAAAGRLLCMVCGAQLPSLHLDHIKSHVLDSHPSSLVYSSQEKHCVLQAWAHAHEDSENSIKSESSTKDGSVDLGAPEAPPPGADSYPDSDGTLTQDTCLIGEDGGVAAPQRAARPHRRPRKRRAAGSGSGSSPWRLRLDYLVAYGPRGQQVFCMVCSQVLSHNKVSSFRRHIEENHPETSGLGPQERRAMAAAWTRDYSSDELSLKEEDESGASPGKTARTEEDGDGGGPAPGPAHSPAPGRHSHYPGKDQKRNYQARWRLDYLMDYDGRRHGLLCMVCGATLATLKVSTIKRHIQQVHPRSLLYGPEERQRALLAYGRGAPPLGHAQARCFSPPEPEAPAEPERRAPSEHADAPAGALTAPPAAPLPAPLPAHL